MKKIIGGHCKKELASRILGTRNKEAKCLMMMESGFSNATVRINSCGFYVLTLDSESNFFQTQPVLWRNAHNVAFNSPPHFLDPERNFSNCAIDLKYLLCQLSSTLALRNLADTMVCPEEKCNRKRMAGRKNIGTSFFGASGMVLRQFLNTASKSTVTNSLPCLTRFS